MSGVTSIIHGQMYIVYMCAGEGEYNTGKHFKKQNENKLKSVKIEIIKRAKESQDYNPRVPKKQRVLLKRRTNYFRNFPLSYTCKFPQAG